MPSRWDYSGEANQDGWAVEETENHDGGAYDAAYYQGLESDGENNSPGDDYDYGEQEFE